jgi:hypothetical protein
MGGGLDSDHLQLHLQQRMCTLRAVVTELRRVEVRPR